MKYVVILLVCFLITGCAGRFQSPIQCDGSGSVILDISGGDPTNLDRALLMLHVAALEGLGGYDSKKARELISEARQIVQEGVSYLQLYSWLGSKTAEANKAAGITLIILGADVPMIASIGGESMLSVCDKELILNHLQKQQLLLAFY